MGTTPGDWLEFNGAFNTNYVILHPYSNRLFEEKLYFNKGKILSMIFEKNNNKGLILKYIKKCK